MKRAYKQSTILEISLREGKNREIRRMLAALGHKVQRLKRVGLGPLKLGKLPQGESRMLEHSELLAIQRMLVGDDQPRSPRRGKQINKTRKSAAGAGKKSSTRGHHVPRKKKSKTRSLRSKKS